MHLALDIDNTITAAPKMFADLAQSVKDNGGTVTIIHGVKATEVTPDDEQEAKTLLAANGFSDDAYDTLAVVPNPISTNKAMYAKQHGVDLFIDNRKKNVKRAASIGVPSAHFT